MPEVTLAQTNDDLRQILLLQQQNLPHNLAEQEMRSQGFVTMQYNMEILEQMHGLLPAVVIKENDEVVGYALSMDRECRQFVPALEPMFCQFAALRWNERPLASTPFYVLGQVCIAKDYRGSGLFEQMFQFHKNTYRSRFDLFVTEISLRNQRSIRAHEKVGFKTIGTYRDQLDEWSIVAWDWS